MSEKRAHDEPLLGVGRPLPPEALSRPTPPDGLRERILARTSAHVRRHAQYRRIRLTAALAAAYVLGLGTALWWTIPAEAPASIPVAAVPAAEVVPAVVAPETPPVAAPDARVPDEILLDAERFALLLTQSSPERRSELFREAGDRWLEARGNYERAILCYRRHLDLAPPRNVADVGSQENWLLRSLKLARLQEKSNEHANT